MGSLPRRALSILALALLVMALNVAATFLYMFVYGHVIAPGHRDAHYHAHAQVAAPYCSVIFGMPLMYFAARWLARRRGSRDGVAIAIVYIAVDLAVLIAAGALASVATIAALSFASKLLAAYAGSRAAAPRIQVVNCDP